MRRRCRERRRNGGKALFTAVFSCVFLVWLIEPLQALAQLGAWSGFTVLLLYALCYPVGVASSFLSSPTLRAVLLAVMSVLGAAMVAVLGPGQSDLLVYLVAVAAVLFPNWVGTSLSGLVTLVAFVVSALRPEGGPSYGMLVLMIALTVGLSRFAQRNAALREANDEVARLAAAEERARVARDIHDVLGHSLTTVTVKLGLVRRLLETNPGAVDRLLAEVSDAEQLSRQALSEVRATLSGHRSATLTAEVAGARVALASAGINADLPRAVDNVTPAYQEPFAYALREGVTNVLRHSGATSCQVLLGESWLEVRDNGTVSAPTAAESRSRGGGTGLAGLAERMAAIGGQLDAGPLSGGGFLLRVSVPQEAVT
ncbi:two-component system sensor histidine kinase DesK [Kutzneria viridogrisea]|uniref:Two-component system sensor histidine kinase DesK n=1 Tax=Kutzneria viridogrisea TaxID=47990 RepID=A0ABR6BKW7_9PSEU|nr:histidine kinase [Kutzneria albida]MBA8927552.1 two-component system sensor histidine kinase DesK [Kutzneria viridogrisea]